jgi:hypothetical protein
MKVFLFITILAGGNPQTQIIPMDSMADCETAKAKIIETNRPLAPGLVTLASCIIQGK